MGGALMLLLSWILEIVYIALPPFALALALRRAMGMRRRAAAARSRALLPVAGPEGVVLPYRDLRPAPRNPSQNEVQAALRPLHDFLMTCISGMVLGSALVFAYAKLTDAQTPMGQVVLTSYFFVAMLILLKGFNNGLRVALEWLFLLRRRPVWSGHLWGFRAFGAVLFRVTALSLLGMPYLMAVVMVYRPKVISSDDPMRQLGFAFTSVHFNATDGTRLDAWWIPAVTRDAEKAPAWAGRRTVVLCHGLGANKGNQLMLARELIPNGYNVVSFDFRAHGASGGQLSSFGDLERRDVLGAVRWVKAAHPEQERIFGLGISMGAAALIAAASDDSDEGRAIDAVAVYDTYDDLGSVVSTIGDTRFVIPPFGWLASHISLPIASAHVGSNLGHFSPAALSPGIAPHPILIIHGRGDDVIAFEHGERLFESASQPKIPFWVGKARYVNGERKFYDSDNTLTDHNGMVNSNEAGRAVRLFFDWGKSIL